MFELYFRSPSSLALALNPRVKSTGAAESNLYACAANDESPYERHVTAHSFVDACADGRGGTIDDSYAELYSLAEEAMAAAGRHSFRSWTLFTVGLNLFEALDFVVLPVLC